MVIRVACSFLFLITTSAQGDFKYYEKPDPKPYLVNIGQFPACDYIIDSPAKWSNINSTSHRVFCVVPGDYSSVGRIHITADGTANAKRWLRYYNPSLADNIHPYHMTTAQRARVKTLFFNSAHHWIVDRIFVQPTSGNNDNAVQVTNSDYNVFNRIYASGPNLIGGFALYNGSDHNVVQHSVVGKIKHGSDGVGFLLNAAYKKGWTPVPPVTFNRIISNECFDMTDCFQTMGYDTRDEGYVREEDYRGTVVYDNDFYLTSASYTDCNGVYKPTGDCACKEDAINIKSGSESSAHPMIIAHNRTWGWRPLDINDKTCVGPSGSGKGSANIVIQALNRNVRFEGNIVAGGGTVISHGYENSSYKNNLHHGTLNPPISGFMQYGIRSFAGPMTNVNVSGNVFVDIRSKPAYKALDWADAVLTSQTITFSNNVLINSGPSNGSTIAGNISGNEYYNTPKPTWDRNPAAEKPSVTGSRWDAQFCTTIKPITAPETKCFANAFPSTGGAAPIESPSAIWVEQ